MNASDLKSFIRQISKEKDLDTGVVKEAIEMAIVSASKRNLAMFNDARVELDADTGILHLFVKKKVVDKVSNPRSEATLKEARHAKKNAAIGDELEVEIDPSVFGRIAAQSARQMVFQKLKDAERMKVYDEYQGKVGEILSGTVHRYERGDLVLSIGKGEAVLPRKEIPMTSHYRIGDRIKVYVLEIDPEAKGPIIKVSRTHPQLVAKLFEQEVPEIADGTVKVVNVVREPGARAKIAVQSTNKDVDPVGACVGVKGSRVQMIVRELENEKIDIVPYSENSKQFITSALVPAQIQSININEDTKQADVIVKKGNLSLAIGKKGQNAKLAHRLTGWKLNIHSEGEEERLAGVNQEEIQRKYMDDLLAQVESLSPEGVEAILASPYNTVQKLAEATFDDVEELVGSGDIADDLIEGARGYVEALKEMTRSSYGDEDDGGQGSDAPVQESTE